MSEYAVMPIDDYKNTCDKVREKTGTEEAIKSGELAGEVEKVFEAGKDEGYKIYWDTKTNNGERSNYAQAFLNEGISMELLRHGRTLKPTGDNRRMFRYVKNTGEEPIDLYKLQQEYNIVFDLSEVTLMGEMFEGAEIENAGIIDISATLQDSAKYNIYFLFAYSEVKRVEKFIVSETSCEFNGTFYHADNLEHCIFEGTIAKKGLTFAQCLKLSYESLVSVINCLSTTTTGLAVIFSKKAVNKAFETSEGANDGSTSAEWATLIATKPNWTISLV